MNMYNIEQLRTLIGMRLELYAAQMALAKLEMEVEQMEGSIGLPAEDASTYLMIDGRLIYIDENHDVDMLANAEPIRAYDADGLVIFKTLPEPGAVVPLAPPPKKKRRTPKKAADQVQAGNKGGGDNGSK